MNTVAVNPLWESLCFRWDLFSSVQHLVFGKWVTNIHGLHSKTQESIDCHIKSNQTSTTDRFILENDFSFKCKFHERMVYIPNDLTWRMHSKIGNLLFLMHLYLIESIGKRPHHISIIIQMDRHLHKRRQRNHAQSMHFAYSLIWNIFFTWTFCLFIIHDWY